MQLLEKTHSSATALCCSGVAWQYIVYSVRCPVVPAFHAHDIGPFHTGRWPVSESVRCGRAFWPGAGDASGAPEFGVGPDCEDEDPFAAAAAAIAACCCASRKRCLQEVAHR